MGSATNTLISLAGNYEETKPILKFYMGKNEDPLSRALSKVDALEKACVRLIQAKEKSKRLTKGNEK